VRDFVQVQARPWHGCEWPTGCRLPPEFDS